MSRFLLAFAVLAGYTSVASAAPPKDVADVFPPGTLVYGELHNPAELGPQLAAVFKGTPLENSIPFIHDKKNGARTLPELLGTRDLAGLALLVSPEALADFKRFGGLAAGLVGFNEKGEPEVVFVVLTGESAAAGVAARAFMTMTPSLRKVGEVSKVAICQYRSPQFKGGDEEKIDNDKLPVEGAHEPTFAYTPGLFVAGTSKAALAPVIKRFLGEEKGSLRDTPGFKAAAEKYRQTGLFFYAAPQEFFTRSAAAAKKSGLPMESDVLAWGKLVAGQKAVKGFAGCVRFRDGGLSLNVGLTLDPTEKSPLGDFLAGPGTKVDLLHHARMPTAYAAAVALPQKNRGAAILGFLDAKAKAAGEIGQLPTDIAQELQERYKLKLGDLLDRVKAVTVLMPTKQKLPAGGQPMPVFVLHFDDAAGAAAIEEVMPMLIAVTAGEKEPAVASSETVAGVKVASLPGTGLKWKAPVHYARKDSVLVIGLDRELVAAALTPDAKAFANVNFPAGAPPILVGTLNVGALLQMRHPRSPLDVPTSPLEPFVPQIHKGRLAPPEEKLRDADKAWLELCTVVGELPPAVVTVRRAGNELQFEVFQPKAAGAGLSPIVTAGVKWLEKLLTARGPNHQ